MSQENVEIVRAVYEALNRGDWDAAFHNMDPSGALTIQRGPDAGTHKGREQVQALIQARFGEPFDLWIQEPEEFFDAGDRVVAFVKTRARPKGTSSETEARTGHLWTICNGRVSSMQSFPDRNDALAAAGLMI